MRLWSRNAKRAAFAGALCLLLLLPVGSWAHSSNVIVAASGTCFPGFVCIDNSGGTAVGSSAGLKMDGTGGSALSKLVGINSQSVSGTLSLTTGAFNKSFGNGICALPPCTVGDFAAGSLSISVNNFNGFSGVLFTGTFGDPTNGIAWVYTGTIGTGANKVYQYELVGPVTGTWEGALTVSGQTAQLLFTSKTPFKGTGTLNLTSGTTSILTPEPASIGLLGTGLLVLGFLVRRKAKQDV